MIDTAIPVLGTGIRFDPIEYLRAVGGDVSGLLKSASDRYIGIVVDPIVERHANREAEVAWIAHDHSFMQCVADGDASAAMVPDLRRVGSRLAGSQAGRRLRDALGDVPMKRGGGGHLQHYSLLTGKYVDDAYLWARSAAGRATKAVLNKYTDPLIYLSIGFGETYSNGRLGELTGNTTYDRARRLGRALGTICGTFLQ